MTTAGRTDHGAARHVMTAVAIGLTSAVTACADPGSTPSDGTADVTVTRYASAVAVPPQARPMPSRVAVAPDVASGSCTTVVPRSPRGSVERTESDAERRSRLALESQSRVPRRSGVPDAAVPAAEACVHAVSPQLDLLAHGQQRPADAAVRAILASAGLTRITVLAGLRFAASTGAACLVGVVAPDGPTLEIAPLARDGSCRP